MLLHPTWEFSRGDSANTDTTEDDNLGLFAEGGDAVADYTLADYTGCNSVPVAISYGGEHRN